MKSVNSEMRAGGLRHIATNSLLLFVRMFVIMLINLFAVRLVLRGLGIEGYGIYNTVAGLVGLSSFLNGVLDVAVQRFYSFYIGKGDWKKVGQTYTISLKIVLLLSVVIVVIFETLGIWALETFLVFPPEMHAAVMVCYQTALVTFVCTLVRIPFTASIMANEDMGWYAGISMAECLLRLLAAVLILYASADALVIYSSAYAAVTLFVLAVYAVYCKLSYPACRWTAASGGKLAGEIFGFSGWNFFGAVSKVGMIQGTMVLLNVFFGPVTTAAFAVATQIQNAFNTFANTIVLAVRPAMIKSYAEENHEFLCKLFFTANKSLYYLLLLVALPIILEMPFILGLWLGHAEAEMVTFCRFMVVYVVILATGNPVTIIMHATGRIKTYTIAVESITLLALPASWVLLSLGAPAAWTVYSMICLCALAHVQRLVCLKREYKPVSIRYYCTSFVPVALIVTVLSCVVSVLIHSCGCHPAGKAALWLVCYPLAECALFYFLGLSVGERRVVKSMVKSGGKGA